MFWGKSKSREREGSVWIREDKSLEIGMEGDKSGWQHVRKGCQHTSLTESLHDHNCQTRLLIKLYSSLFSVCVLSSRYVCMYNHWQASVWTSWWAGRGQVPATGGRVIGHSGYQLEGLGSGANCWRDSVCVCVCVFVTARKLLSWLAQQ